MSPPRPQRFHSHEECVDALIERLGKRIVLGLPVGLGKPVPFVNALVQRACADPQLHLTLLTALSFRRPTGKSDLERRLVEPLAERIFGDTPALDYVTLLERGTLPANIEIVEFFLEPGGWLGNHHLQERYLSANYTHVIRDALALGLNAMAQIVAPPPAGEGSQSDLSLSCNPDLTVDLLPHIAAARAQGRPFVLLGELHRGLPYMDGDAIVPESSFDFLVETPEPDFRLFSPPNPPLDRADHLIGLAVSALIKDGGTLQLGIGELGDAIVNSLLVRQKQPALYREALECSRLLESSALIEAEGGTTPFERGLYGCSEMLVDGFLELYSNGILKRHVYPSVRIQHLLDAGAITDHIGADYLEALHAAGIRRLSFVDYQELKEVGVFREGVGFENGLLVAPDGAAIPVDLDDPRSRAAIAAQCLGEKLRNGVVLDAGFFFGPADFYASLHRLAPAERRQFAMRGISFINDLHGPEQELKAVQRRDARFINSTMMVTGLGAAVSDALSDGRVVSGVGGQYNFVAMAHQLPGARSILCLRSTHTRAGKTTSNIVWNYGHITIPRHLRDLVVTEYGIADLRGRTDSAVAAALIGVADARFQEGLADAAKRAGKLPRDWRIPDTARGNTPASVASRLRPLEQAGVAGEYPFGTDLTAEEIRLAKALRWLAAATATPGRRIRTLTQAWMSPVEPDAHSCLERMNLSRPRGWRERLQRNLVALALTRSR